MRYRILEPIGKGGMGEVFLAEDSELERKVALKFLPEALQSDATALTRLRREAKAAAALDHPYICKVYELGETEDGRAFIAMEYVEGETLASRMERDPLSLRDALHAACEMAEALEAAHARNIVHRDLKPANVMLGHNGHVKVTDFGLAKEIRSQGTDSEAVTRSGTLAGTPGYMSPEQLRGEVVDGRSDLFAFGVVLQELLTGAHPFKKNSGAETIAAILKELPTGQESLPAALQPLVARLLSKRAEDRPLLSEIRTELERLVEHPGRMQASATRRRPFVGREAEISELRGLVDRLRSGEGGLVLIGGEPGIGKTRLSEEVLFHAREQGYLTLEGHSYETETVQPYLPWVEGLEMAARVVPSDPFREALGESAPEIAKLMPELRRSYEDISEPIPLPPEQQRRYLFNSFQEFVDRLSHKSPLVWLLDDLHWADESSLLLLEHLAQKLQTLPILFLGTYRDVELDVGKPFEQMLAQLVRQRLAQRRPLKRLPENDTRELLTELGESAAPNALVRAVYDATEGNPFFVEEVFQHLKEQGKLFNEDGSWVSDESVDDVEVPEGVRLVIGRRLERLASETQKFLTAASVIGRVFDARVLEVMESFDVESVDRSLDEAERAQLVVTQAQGRDVRYSFSHELTRHTLVTNTSLRRRQALHLEIAVALERLGKQQANPAELAHHLFEAGSSADPVKTTEYLKLAGERALESAAAEDALRFFEQAISVDESGDAKLVAGIMVNKGVALRSLQRWLEASEVWTNALPLLEKLRDSARLARTCSEIGSIYWNIGQPEDGMRVIRRGLTAVGESPSIERCRLLASAGETLGMMVEDDGSAEAMMDESLRLAEELQDRATLGQVLRRRAVIDFSRLRIREMAESAQRAAGLLREQGDSWELSEALLWARNSTFMLGRLEEAEAIALELRPLAEKVGNAPALASSAIIDGVRELMLFAKLDAAEIHFRHVMDLTRKVGAFWESHAFLYLGKVDFWRGHFEDALEKLETSSQLDPPTTRWHGICDAGFFYLKAYAGHADALAFLYDHFELSTLGKVRSPGNWWSMAYVAEGLALLGECDQAASLYPHVAEACDSGAVSAGAVMQGWQKVVGITAAAGRDWERATAHYETALEQYREIPYRLEEPEVRRWYAKMFIDRDAPGDRDKARQLLEEAIEGYRAIGMPRHLELAKALTASL